MSRRRATHLIDDHSGNGLRNEHQALRSTSANREARQHTSNFVFTYWTPLVGAEPNNSKQAGKMHVSQDMSAAQAVLQLAR